MFFTKSSVASKLKDAPLVSYSVASICASGVDVWDRVSLEETALHTLHARIVVVAQGCCVLVPHLS